MQRSYTGRLQTKRKYLQSTYLTKGQNLEYIKNFQNSIVKKENKPIRKWAKGMNRHFIEEHLDVANKHMKGCSRSSPIREMQIIATVR